MGFSVEGNDVGSDTLGMFVGKYVEKHVMGTLLYCRNVTPVFGTKNQSNPVNGKLASDVSVAVIVFPSASRKDHIPVNKARLLESST